MMAAAVTARSHDAVTMRAMLAAESIVFEELPAAQRTLRIAVVTETYPPEVNGVATSAARFVEGLRDLGHEIQLVRPRQGRSDAASDVLMRGMTIPFYAGLRVGLPAKRALERLWMLRRPEVVHIVTEGPLGWSALRAAKKLKLPVVSDFRTNFHVYSSHYGIGWLRRPILGYLRNFHNRTAATLVPTAGLQGELAQRGFLRLKVIARGVDTTLFDPARRDGELRRRWGAAPDDPVLIHVGRLAPEKNIATIVAAYDAVREQTPNARLVLVGDGPLRRELQARRADIVFCGSRHGEDLARYFASGDIFLFPSLTETYGNVTLEAMASGLAVVAFAYAAAAEVIHPEASGVLVPFGDGAAFARAAAGLATDHWRAARLGAAARGVARQRSWTSVVRELEEVLLAVDAARPLDHRGRQPGRRVRGLAVRPQGL